MMATFFFHSNLVAFAKSACLALVSATYIDDAVILLAADIDQTSPHTALKEAAAPVTGKNTVVPS